MIVVALALALAACGDSDEGGGSTLVSLSGKTNEHGTKTATAELEVEADDFYFEPTYIKATAGQAFTVEIHNEGKVAHTFTSTALGVDQEVAAGEKKTITLTAPPSGNALFFCRFHQSQGMQGAVFVA